MVVTADEAVRGGKTIAIVDEAVQDCQCVQRVLVSRRTGADVAMTQRDIQLEKVSLTLHRTTAKLTLTHIAGDKQIYRKIVPVERLGWLASARQS